jgi:hypothetical protein
MVLLTRRRIAGVVLALALAGALSAGVASGVERVRGKARKRPEPPPPFSQREKVQARMDEDTEALPRVTRPATTRPRVSEEAVVSQGQGGAPARAERSGSIRSRLKSRASGSTVSEEAGLAPEDHADAHAAEASMAGLTARIPAPMRVSWTAVEASEGRVRLVAEVERRRGFSAPVAVRLSLPRGAQLVEGPVDFTVPEGPGGDVRTVAYVVTYATGSRPAEDLVLVADAEGTSFGAHAEERYAFGRTKAVAPSPVPEGPMLPPSLMMGGTAIPASETGE